MEYGLPQDSNIRIPQSDLPFLFHNTINSSLSVEGTPYSNNKWEDMIPFQNKYALSAHLSMLLEPNSTWP
jgi:hypothetical protein